MNGSSEFGREEGEDCHIGRKSDGNRFLGFTNCRLGTYWTAPIFLKLYGLAIELTFKLSFFYFHI